MKQHLKKIELYKQKRRIPNQTQKQRAKKSKGRWG